ILISTPPRTTSCPIPIQPALTTPRRIAAAVAAAGIALGIAAAPAAACGGLVAPNGAVRLLRTSTLAAYHDGVEHYVTSFQFAGGGESAPSTGRNEFGSIVPLPCVRTNVQRGGHWRMQGLSREVLRSVARSQR